MEQKTDLLESTTPTVSDTKPLPAATGDTPEKVSDQLKAMQDRIDAVLRENEKLHKENAERRVKAKEATAAAEREAAEKGEYQKATELHKKQVADWETERAKLADDAAKARATSIRSLAKLNMSGKVNPDWNPDDVLVFMPGLELDESGNIRDFDQQLSDLLASKPGLRPTSRQTGLTPQKTGGGAATTVTTKEAKQLAEQFGLPETTATMILSDPKRLAYYQAQGLVTEFDGSLLTS